MEGDVLASKGANFYIMDIFLSEDLVTIEEADVIEG
jgi:hypothetical protein